MDVRKIVGVNIKNHRIAAGLTQEELAARMGVEQYYVSGLEAGRRNPTVVTLWHAAQALGIKTAQLLDEMSDQTKSQLERRRPTVRKSKRRSGPRK